MGDDNPEDGDVVPTSLTTEIAAGGLSMLKDVGHLSFNYTKLDLTGKALVDLQELNKYTALLLLDLSDNQISDVSQLSKLPALMSAKLDNNKITSLDVSTTLECLQLLSLKSNELTAVPQLNMPTLLHLNLDGNQVSSLEGAFSCSSKLRTLHVRDNKLSSSIGIENLQELEEAYFCTNEITEVKLGNPQLRTLDLSTNQISSLASFENTVGHLEHLDLNTNQIASVKELAHLVGLRCLKTLKLAENPVTGLDGYRKHVHAILPQLETLDGELWADEDLEDPPPIVEEESPE